MDFPNPGIDQVSAALQADSLPVEHFEKTSLIEEILKSNNKSLYSRLITEGKLKYNFFRWKDSFRSYIPIL